MQTGARARCFHRDQQYQAPTPTTKKVTKKKRPTARPALSASRTIAPPPVRLSAEPLADAERLAVEDAMALYVDSSEAPNDFVLVCDLAADDERV